MGRRRVVITGIGSINPLARTMAGTWSRLEAGASGVTRISRFDPAELGLETHITGEVKGFGAADCMDAGAARRTDRFTYLAVAAATEALRESGLVVVCPFPSPGRSGARRIRQPRPDPGSPGAALPVHR